MDQAFANNPLFNQPPAGAAPAVPSPSIQATTTAVEVPQPVAAVQDDGLVIDKPSEPKPRPVNFELRHPFTQGEQPFDKEQVNVSYPSGARQATMDKLQNTPNININGKKVDDLAGVLRDGLEQIPMSDDMNGLRGREGAMFKQEVEVNGSYLGGFVPKFKLRDGVKPSGELARNLVRSSMRLGTVFCTPLWHSGFWLTIRTPSEGDLIELHRALAAETTTLGRSTYGVLFSQMTGYTTKVMVDFIEAHMHSASLLVPEGKRVVDYIKAADYQLLVWGLTCATWPNGYQIRRACITDPEKCNYILSEKVNVPRLLWVDHSSLTERQKLHMLNRQTNTVTPEKLELYAADFVRGKNASVKLADGIAMQLKMPTMMEYIEASYEWIGKLEEQQNRVMSMREDDRNEYLMQHAQAQSMRQYSHFVQSITVGDDEIDDAETLPLILADLSSDDVIRRAFVEQVQKFQNEALIAFVALPNYKCPSCGGMQAPTAVAGQQNELIALDVTQTFFTLLMQKLKQIQDR